MLRNKDLRVARLADVEVLSGLSKRALREVAALTTEVRLRAGHVLCTQGDVGREVFLLIEGSVTVTKDGSPLGVVNDGEVLGEMAVLDGCPRLATLTALTEVTVLALSSREFSSLIARFPSVAEEIRSLVHTRAGEPFLVASASSAGPARRGVSASFG